MGVCPCGDAHFTESVYDQKTAQASLRLKTKVWIPKKRQPNTGNQTLVPIEFDPFTKLLLGFVELSRVVIHPREKHPQIRELLPFVARHFIEERALAVDDFVVAQHQDEVLGERVHEREGNVVVVKAAEVESPPPFLALKTKGAELTGSGVPPILQIPLG